MCGRVLVGEQKDILITGRDGRQFKPKPNSTGNPGSMLTVVTDSLPDKVQQYRWGLLTADDETIHAKHKHAKIENLHTPGVTNWVKNIASSVSRHFLNTTKSKRDPTASSVRMESPFISRDCGISGWMWILMYCYQLV